MLTGGLNAGWSNQPRQGRSEAHGVANKRCQVYACRRGRDGEPALFCLRRTSEYVEGVSDARKQWQASFQLLLSAEVVEWQTRTFEGRVAQAVRVQVPPSAPLIWAVPAGFLPKALGHLDLDFHRFS